MTINILENILTNIKVGTVIPKPDAKKDFIVKGWGKRRKEDALIYFIPNHKNPNKPYQKGITKSEFEESYQL